MADLDGKTYASYGGRFEMAILRQMIKNAGGKGDVVEVLPPKLDCFFKSVAKGVLTIKSKYMSLHIETSIWF